MRIGELARHTGTTTKTIRYYEEIGLLSEPDRDVNDYRNYPVEAIERLRFVRAAQATGLTLTEIASILDLRSHGEETCRHVVDLLDRHLAALDEHIEKLGQTRTRLAELTKRARRMDPSDCVDPNRCQTINSEDAGQLRTAKADRHLHATPGEHRH